MEEIHKHLLQKYNNSSNDCCRVYRNRIIEKMFSEATKGNKMSEFQIDDLSERQMTRLEDALFEYGFTRWSTDHHKLGYPVYQITDSEGKNEFCVVITDKKINSKFWRWMYFWFGK